MGLLRWGTVAAMAGVYEIVARVFFAGSIFLPPISKVATTGVSVFTQAGILSGLRTTAVEYGIALGLAAVTGVAVGAALGAATRSRGVSRDLFQVLMALPQVAVYPIFLLFFGIGPIAKIIFGLTHGFFPIALGTMTGFGQVEETLPRAVRAMGGGRIAVAWRAVLPSALPSVLTGLRIGAELCLVGVLLAELLTSAGGTGAQVLILSATSRTPQLYALVVGICAAAFAANTIMVAIERRLTRWRG